MQLTYDTINPDPSIVHKETNPPVNPGDDEEWEDLPDNDASQLDGARLSKSPRFPSLRRRKTSKGQVRRPAPRPARPDKTKDDDSPLLAVDKKQIKGAVRVGATNLWEYLRDVSADVFWLLKKPIALLVWLVVVLGIFSKIASTLRTTFQPICYLPGFSRTTFCVPIFEPQSETRSPKWADYPKLTEVQSTTFEKLLDESVDGSALSLEVKKAEMATSDLVAMVRISDFKTKDLVAKSLLDFTEDARRTGRALQRLSAKIGGAVDSIVAVNDHALHTIEAHLNKPKTALDVIKFWKDDTTKELVTQTFTDAMSTLSNNIGRVILEAQVSLSHLDKLDQHLITLHEILARENQTISEEKNELLANLWTMLGGNQRQLRRFNGNLEILKSIGDYRMRARAHVAAALQSLEGMSEDMEDLRERVAMPELVGERISVEVHMKSIKAGLDRLTQKRLNAQLQETKAVQQILGAPQND